MTNWDEVWEMRKSGVSVKTLSKMYGVEKSEIITNCDVLKQRDKYLKKYGYKFEAIDKIAQEAHDRGISYGQLQVEETCRKLRMGVRV